MAPVRISTTAMAAGGEAVGRDDEGRVTFVAGALPGETVEVSLDDERSRYARGRALTVLEASPDRRRPPCPRVADGCGGCDWQHVEPAAASGLRTGIVAEALERLGGASGVAVTPGPALAPTGYRTTVRAGIIAGRPGLRRRRSHDLVRVDACQIADPLVDEVLAEGRFPGATEVTVRVGARTGQRLVVVRPRAVDVAVPGDVAVVGTDELARGRRAWITEEVSGRRWRISASSFFQARPDGAEALVEVVRDLVGDHRGDEPLVDLCAGVGLFAGTVAGGRSVVAVERHRPAVTDARHNLADRDVSVVRAPVAGWRASPAGVVVADPARDGLGAAGVGAVDATGADRLILVSCDPGALGGDTRRLAGIGFHPTRSVVLDLFANTSAVEAVTAFER